MKIYKFPILFLMSILPLFASAQETKLSGEVVGSNMEQALNAFDNDHNTYFLGEGYSANPYTYTYGRNWAGLDLGDSHVITKVGIMACPGFEKFVQFAVVQGANRADFLDAIPLTMLKTPTTPYEMTYLDVEVSRGVRYVRVVATNSEGFFAEIEFYGNKGEGNNSKFYQITNLPTVSFNTPGMAEIKSKNDKHPDSYIAIVSENGTKILEDAEAQMKGRGNGSWTFNKKPFQIKFNKKQQPLSGTAKAKKWTLINNYGDRTLMRNKVAFDISREVGMPYTPHCEFVDVIYNGEYEGTYQLCDQVEVGDGRVELTEMETTDISGENLSGGYFIEIDAYAYQETSMFMSNRGVPVTIKYPDEDDITIEQSSYIRNYFNDFEEALFSHDFTDEQSGYRQYLDLESFLRYFIICELDGNLDSFWSTYIYKERNDPLLHVGPIWDVDLGFQNYGNPKANQMGDFLYTHPDASKASGMLEFVNRIVKDDAAAKILLSDIWSELRQNGNLNYDFFENRIIEYSKQLDESQKLNFERWQILNMSVQKNQEIFYTYEGELNNILTFLEERFELLDVWLERHPVVGIDDITIDMANPDTPIEIYDIRGIRLDNDNLTPGIYIRRQGNKSEKIIIKR